MSKDVKKVEKKEEALPAVDPQELLKRIMFKPAALGWKNFNQEQPGLGRWFILWCNLGPIAQNLFLSYRDNLGNYDLPHPTKQYPAQAWAYIDFPEVDQKSLETAEAKLREEMAKPKATAEVVQKA